MNSNYHRSSAASEAVFLPIDNNRNLLGVKLMPVDKSTAIQQCCPARTLFNKKFAILEQKEDYQVRSKHLGKVDFDCKVSNAYREEKIDNICVDMALNDFCC